MSKIKSYNNFLFEGHREQAKINELLDAASTRRLTDDEKDLLKRLSMGEKLPPEELKKDKTGGLLTDEKGNIITQDDPSIKKDGEFFTEKGKSRSAEKMEKRISEASSNARVYRSKDSEERFFFIYMKSENPYWIIYRTGINEKHPLGQFMNTSDPKWSYFNKKSTDQLWAENDKQFDYGMILDDELQELFLNFIELYKDKENEKRNVTEIKKIRNRFITLL
jgi:hypothetical protein